MHVQFKCRGFSRITRVHVSRQLLDAVLSIACLPPLQYMLFPLAGVFGPGSCRRRHQSTTATSISTKTKRQRGPHREAGHFLRGCHLVEGARGTLGSFLLEVWSVRADVRSCCYGLMKRSYCGVARDNHLCDQCLHIIFA